MPRNASLENTKSNIWGMLSQLKAHMLIHTRWRKSRTTQLSKGDPILPHVSILLLVIYPQILRQGSTTLRYLQEGPTILLERRSAKVI